MFKTPCFAAVLCACAVAPALAAGAFYVDGASPSCSDSGPGTSVTPYCTISAAVGARRGPGTIILVQPGIYREQVTVPSSGDSDNRIEIRALGPGAIVDGADDFTSAAQWRHFKKKVWLARDVTWAPQQVFADGARLEPSTQPSDKIPSGTFRYQEGQGLYVNVGGRGSRGDNPGTHDLGVGRRLYGFRLSGRSWVSVEGFNVTRTEDKGIYILNGSHHAIVARNVVRLAGSHGIGVAYCSGVLVASNVTSDNSNHGIAFTNGVTGSTIEDNESFGNARPTERAANGIYLYGSTENLIRRNRAHRNQDTGFEVGRGAHDNVLVQNLSWSNGDHGYDSIHASRTFHIGNVAWGNFKDGFSVEGEATGTRVYNCIAVDNGLTTGEYNLYVDGGSAQGFTSDYNIFWNSTLQTPIKYNQVIYANTAEFSNGTGLDVHSIQADPMFADPAAGDFQLRSGSPAIDSGDASAPYWPATDALGRPRFDDPYTLNTGVGPIAYADRGAIEYIATALAAGQPQPPSGISLSAAYPNPSPRGVTLTLELPHARRFAWAVYDPQGRRVWGTLEELPAGRSSLHWRGEDGEGHRVRSGLYFAHLEIAGERLVRRIVLVH